jgi:hypothetical protein
MDWMKNDDLFFKELEAGHSWAQYVADRLNSLDVACYATDMEKRKSLSDRARFRNEKDVVLTKMSGCIEVKSRRLRFSDVPSSFPMDSAFVDTVSGWARKSPRPLAVCVVSQLTGSILVIPVSSEDSWGSVTKFDRVRKIEETWLTADRRLMKPFAEFVSWLKARQV